jgi:hypothetical protein
VVIYTHRCRGCGHLWRSTTNPAMGFKVITRFCPICITGHVARITEASLDRLIRDERLEVLAP